MHDLLSISMQAVALVQDMDYNERKRQYAALRRAILKDANPALTAKFSLSDDGERRAVLRSMQTRRALMSLGAGLVCSKRSWSTRGSRPLKLRRNTTTLFVSSEVTGMSLP